MSPLARGGNSGILSIIYITMGAMPPPPPSPRGGRGALDLHMETRCLRLMVYQMSVANMYSLREVAIRSDILYPPGFFFPENWFECT